MKKHTDGSESRRDFLRSAFAVGITAAATVIPVDQIHASTGKKPPADSARPLVFFRPEEAQFLAAAVDRFIPPDDEWPGAVDAGVVEYIDQQMAGKWGSAGYMYWHGPFKEGTPSQGYQLPFTPAELFRRAVAAINEHFAAQGKAFHLLAPEEQDQYLQMLLANGTTLNNVPSRIFADFLLQHTIEGFFADPIYGGNKNMAGWRMLGFPGPYADYYELIDQHGVKLDREPVSIASGARHHATQRQE
jgi:gluconate 2-dehydrogenase gamma chain